MTRNLDKRVELLIPVEDPTCRAKLLHLLETGFSDTGKGSTILADGGYVRRDTSRKKGQVHSQVQLHDEAVKRSKKARERARTRFEPVGPPTEE